jgi:hypothetical protein
LSRNRFVIRTICQFERISVSSLPHPGHSHEISVILEILLDLTVESPSNRLANAARQVDVRGIDHDSPRVFLDTDDAVERLLLLLGLISALCDARSTMSQTSRLIR